MGGRLPNPAPHVRTGRVLYQRWDVPESRATSPSPEQGRRDLPQGGCIHEDPPDRYVRSQAGAIAYVTYRLPIGSSKLMDMIREEQSVLLVPGEMFGLGKGFRIGFGNDIEKTLKGLARVDEVLPRL